MGRKVKCKFCNKEIDKDKAYAVEYLTSSLSLRHHYYCNKECEKRKIEKDNRKVRLKEIEVEARELTRELLGIGSEKNIYFSKMYKDLRDTFGDEKIYEYVKNEEVNIDMILNSKDFKSTNSKVKYFFAMAQNQLEYYKVENNIPESMKTDEEFYIDDFEIKDIVNDDKKRSLNDILKNM